MIRSGRTFSLVADFLDFGAMLTLSQSSRVYRSLLGDVDRVNLTHTCHCHTSLLRIFPNARTVFARIVVGTPTSTSHTVNTEMTRRLPFALTALPGLVNLYLCDDENYWCFDDWLSSEGVIINETIDYLMWNLSAVLRAHTMSTLTWIRLGENVCPGPGTLSGGTCYCRAVLDTFPPLNLFKFVADPGLCVDPLQIAHAAVRRNGNVNARFPDDPNDTMFHYIIKKFIPGQSDYRVAIPSNYILIVLNYLVEHGSAQMSDSLQRDSASGKLYWDLIRRQDTQDGHVHFPEALSHEVDPTDHASAVCQWVRDVFSVPVFVPPHDAAPDLNYEVVLPPTQTRSSIIITALQITLMKFMHFLHWIVFRIDIFVHWLRTATVIEFQIWYVKCWLCVATIISALLAAVALLYWLGMSDEQHQELALTLRSWVRSCIDFLLFLFTALGLEFHVEFLINGGADPATIENSSWPIPRKTLSDYVHVNRVVPWEDGLGSAVSFLAPAGAHLTALGIAARTGHLNILKLLLDGRANPQRTTRELLTLSPLAAAASAGHADILRVLLQTRVDLGSGINGLTTLSIAALNGHAECVDALMTHGADPNSGDFAAGLTPLQYAEWQHWAGFTLASKRHQAVMQVLRRVLPPIWMRGVFWARLLYRRFSGTASCKYYQRDLSQ